ncbi:MAG: cupin domain-containing protein [Kordiimonadaceae bacterium]|nr:cupin domain-containing protein [Kordiimonadaceae bacterium]
MQTLQSIIDTLDLAPHPEGGFYKRMYENDAGPEGRGHATAIYYLLEGQKFAKWHKVVDADELWFWHAGAPLTLEIDAKQKGVQAYTLGIDIPAGERPQITVRAGEWQRARCDGDWTLVSCCVSPGFLFENYDLVEDPDWHPNQA